MNCVECEQDRPIAARGLCRTCYSRWQRSPSFSEREVADRGHCSVEGCDAKVHGQGLCSKHLLRLRRTGTTDPGRTYPQKTNTASQHDLYVQWTEFRRVKNTRPVVDRWKEDFAVFVLEVGGQRPSRRHRLYPIDRSKPMGPGNFEWREALVQKLPGEDSVAYNKRQKAAHKKMYPGQYKDANLRRNFGPDFGLAEYDALHVAQGGKCAICGNIETARDRAGNVKMLAVEHDHRTGAIRSLACHSCNAVLGHAADDVRILESAIRYLKKHCAQPTETRFIKGCDE